MGQNWTSPDTSLASPWRWRLKAGRLTSQGWGLREEHSSFLKHLHAQLAYTLFRLLVFDSLYTIELKTMILESLLLVSGPMSFCPNISDRIVSCFTLSVNQSSQFTSSVDPVAPYPILGTSRLCREIKNELSEVSSAPFFRKTSFLSELKGLRNFLM